MKIVLAEQYLNFVDPSAAELAQIEKVSENVVITETANGIKVKGEKEELFTILCKLSFYNDIEVI